MVVFSSGFLLMMPVTCSMSVLADSWSLLTGVVLSSPRVAQKAARLGVEDVADRVVRPHEDRTALGLVHRLLPGGAAIGAFISSVSGEPDQVARQ